MPIRQADHRSRSPGDCGENALGFDLAHAAAGLPEVSHITLPGYAVGLCSPIVQRPRPLHLWTCAMRSLRVCGEPPDSARHGRSDVMASRRRVRLRPQAGSWPEVDAPLTVDAAAIPCGLATRRATSILADYARRSTFKPSASVPRVEFLKWFGR